MSSQHPTLPQLRVFLFLSANSLPMSFCASSEASSKWLDAHYDPVANIHTFSACLGESWGAEGLELGRC